MKCPAMVMIGSAGRNVGKTEFASTLIRRLAQETQVVGVKITTVGESGSGCPRGGQGCGVCGALVGKYDILEEKQAGPRKDTERMLAAGATHVLWLRVRRNSLKHGVRALLRRVPESAAIVCESNSARSVLEPGVFLVIREAGTSTVKASCRRVIGEADRIAVFDGDGWDVPPERIVFLRERWLIRQKATAVVLAGGRSRRMGRDKSLLPLNGKPLIQRIIEQLKPAFDGLLVGANDAEKYRFLNAEVVPDLEPDRGPLMGILSCLVRSKHDLNFVTGCDIPEMHISFILEMLKLAGEYDIVMPAWPNGDKEPLFAVYRKSLIEPARAILERGGRQIVELFEYAKVRIVDMPDTGWYRNLNTMQDYTLARAVAESSSGGQHDSV